MRIRGETGVSLNDKDEWMRPAGIRVTAHEMCGKSVKKIIYQIWKKSITCSINSLNSYFTDELRS